MEERPMVVTLDGSSSLLPSEEIEKSEPIIKYVPQELVGRATFGDLIDYMVDDVVDKNNPEPLSAKERNMAEIIKNYIAIASSGNDIMMRVYTGEDLSKSYLLSDRVKDNAKTTTKTEIVDGMPIEYKALDMIVEQHHTSRFF